LPERLLPGVENIIPDADHAPQQALAQEKNKK
jgi:hypothetical protein